MFFCHWVLFVPHDFIFIFLTCRFALFVNQNHWQKAWSLVWIRFWPWISTATRAMTSSSTQVLFSSSFSVLSFCFWPAGSECTSILFAPVDNFVVVITSCYLPCKHCLSSFFPTVDAIPSPYLAYETPAGPPITDDGNNNNSGNTKRSSSSGGASRWVWWPFFVLWVLLSQVHCHQFNSASITWYWLFFVPFCPCVLLIIHAFHSLCLSHITKFLAVARRLARRKSPAAAAAVPWTTRKFSFLSLFHCALSTWFGLMCLYILHTALH